MRRLLENFDLIKKDRTTQPWNIDKTIASIIKAGVDVKLATKIGNQVEMWARSNLEKNTVKSSQIRDKIIELLAADDPMAANSYKDYKKG